MINIFFEGVEVSFSEFLKRLSHFLEEMLIDFDKEDYAVSLVLSDDKYIEKLNKTYRGVSKPTDVLSFPFIEGEDIPYCEEKELGDIIISVETMERQSKEYGVSEEEEFARLAIHGILHLLGFDHEKSKEEEKKMFELQDKYLEKFLEGKGE